jgi:hypothetical protein
MEEQGEEGEEAEEGGKTSEARRASGKGIVGAIEGANADGLGDYKWFNDLIKASRKLTNAGFKG